MHQGDPKPPAADRPAPSPETGVSVQVLAAQYFAEMQLLAGTATL